MKKLKIHYSSDKSASNGVAECVVSESIGNAILIMAQGTRNLLSNHYTRVISCFNGKHDFNPNVIPALRYGRLKLGSAPHLKPSKHCI